MRDVEHGIRRVALTGGIATGKSYVRAVFEELRVPVIDSDVLARDAVAPGTTGLAAVIDRFGRDVLREDGFLNRQKLAGIVFANPEVRRALEAIVHPEVRRATDDWFAALDVHRHPYAVADIPLLYEVGRDQDFDTIIVAACDPEMQVRRVMERDEISELEARQRLAVQLPIAEKARRADYVIRTDSTFADTARQIQQVWEALNASS